MFSAVLLISLAAQAEPAVTLDLPITPLPIICREMESQTGVPHLVTGPDRGQQVFVRVTKMPASRLRATLAEVTQGKWVKSGDGFMLLTSEESSKSDAAYRKRITAWLKKEPTVPPLDQRAVDDAIKKSIQRPAVDMDRGLGFEEMFSMNSQTPKRRYVVRLAQGIGLNDLLTISEDERRVYALNPTSLQRRLPANASAATSEYLRETRLFSDSARRLAPAKVGGDEDQYNPLVDPYLGERPMEAPAAILLVMKRTMGSLMADVKLYNSKGLLYDSITEPLGSDQIMEAVMAAEGKEGETMHPALKGLEVPLKLSPEDKAFAKDLKAAFMGGAGGVPAVSESTRQRLMNMDKVDPLLFGPTQMLAQLADIKKKQVVAKVTDLAIFSAVFGADMEKEPTLTTALSLALGAFMTKADGIVEQDDLLSLRPTPGDFFPFSPEMDRAATAGFFRAIVGGGDTLDATANLAVTCKSAMDLQLPLMLGMLLGGEPQTYFDESSFNLFKLYGMLDASQKRAVKQGGCVLPLSGLIGPIAAHSRKMLLSGESLIYGISTSAPAAPSPSLQASQVEFPIYDEGSNEKYDDEITVKLARMPAHLGVLRISMVSKEAIFMKTGTGPASSTTEAEASQTAYSLASEEMFPTEEYAKVRGFVHGTQRTLTSAFVFGKETLGQAMLQAPLIPKGARLMSFKDLPAAFQEEVRRELVEARKSLQEIPRGDGGGGVKPPRSTLD